MGLSVITFDWTQITWVGNPLMIPWWAAIQTFGGFVLFYWIIMPALYYTDVRIFCFFFLYNLSAEHHVQAWHLAHLPMFGNTPFDRFAKPYNVTRVLNSDQTLNVEAFNEYSPLYLPAAYAVTYLIAFVLSSSVIVHTALYYSRNLLNGFKRIKIEKDDIHAKLMRSYPEVPDWWYLSVFALFFALMIVANEVRFSPCVVFRIDIDLLRFAGVAHWASSMGAASVYRAPDVVYTPGWVHLRYVRTVGKQIRRCIAFLWTKCWHA